MLLKRREFMLTLSRKDPRRAGASTGPGGKGELGRAVWLVFGCLRLWGRENMVRFWSLYQT